MRDQPPLGADLVHDAELMRALLEAAPDAMVIADREGRIVLVNQQAERIFGYDRTDLVGEPIEILIPPRYHKSHPAQRETYYAAPRVRPMGPGLDLLARRKDGSEFPVEISLSPLETAAGMLVISAIRDVSEKKRAERVEREQFVTKKLVRRMLRDAAARGDSPAERRQLGRDLGSEGEWKDAQAYLEAFAAMGLGEVEVERLDADKVTLRGKDLLEVTPGYRGTTCHLALGFLEGAVQRLTGGDALGAETACQSQGQPHCTFIIHARRKPPAPARSGVK